MSGLTVLHTSDWHLGHQLYRRRRDEEFEAFLDWMARTIAERRVDCLIIAGDVFDTGAPGAASQRMYYDFLQKAAQAGARHILITAGNHDSPAFLTAASNILRTLKVYVIGSVTENVEDEIIVLRDAGGGAEAIVCAVPYLPERDARRFQPDEDIADRERRLAAGIAAHYARIASLAESLRGDRNIPVIATGHLFTTGAVTGDGVRDLYVGTLGRLTHDIFPETFDYVALGHIHKPQKVGGLETRRYSGSPLPMSFAEAGQAKGSVLVHFDGRSTQIEILQIPEFRKFRTLRGSRSEILGELENMLGESHEQRVWLEIDHDGSDPAGDLYRAAHELAAGSQLEILCIRTRRRTGPQASVNAGRRLEEFTPEEMFEQRLAQTGRDEAEQIRLKQTFRELLALLHEEQRVGEE